MLAAAGKNNYVVAVTLCYDIRTKKPFENAALRVMHSGDEGISFNERIAFPEATDIQDLQIL